VFFMKTKLYGSTAWIKKAYRVALQEVNSERN
ncbi:TPA: hypothetical protein ACHJTU_004812, partial [Escherichia coli]